MNEPTKRGGPGSGDPDGKVCTKCLEYKPLSDFHSSGKAAGGKHPHCAKGVQEVRRPPRAGA